MIDLADSTVEAGRFSAGPVDLEVHDGRYVVLLGPSGAGKSLVLEAWPACGRPPLALC